MIPTSKAGVKEFGSKDSAQCPTLKIFPWTDGRTNTIVYIDPCVPHNDKKKPQKQNKNKQPCHSNFTSWSRRSFWRCWSVYSPVSPVNLCWSVILRSHRIQVIPRSSFPKNFGRWILPSSSPFQNGAPKGSALSSVLFVFYTFSSSSGVDTYSMSHHYCFWWNQLCVTEPASAPLNISPPPPPTLHTHTHPYLQSPISQLQSSMNLAKLKLSAPSPPPKKKETKNNNPKTTENKK